MIVCPIKIVPKDHLPQQVCRTCLGVVVDAYKLRDISSNNDHYLRSILSDEDVESDEALELKNEIIESQQLNDDELEATQNSDCEPHQEEPHGKNDFIIYETTVEEEESQSELIEIEYQVDCFRKSLKSAVWNFFGRLTSGENHIDKDYLYCKICVEDHQRLKPKYRATSTATSVLFSHLRKFHNLRKEDIPEYSNGPVQTHHQTPNEMITCQICNESVNATSMEIHNSIEHPNGELIRVAEKKSDYTVNCFKKSSKSLAWSYFGALSNDHDEIVDKYYFYCRLCVEEKGKLLPKYTKSTSTSILLQHLQKAHVPKNDEASSKRKLPQPIMMQSKRTKPQTLNSSTKITEDEEMNILSQNNDCQELKCQICQKEYQSSEKLSKHMLTHSKVANAQCNQCPAILSSAASLKRHQNCHLGKRLFCNYPNCDASYTESKTLRIHQLKVHEGQSLNNIPCSQCDMKFRNEWSVRRHQLTHSGKKAI